CPCPQSSFPDSAKSLVTSKAMKSSMNFFFNYFTKITPLVRLVIYAATNDCKFAAGYDVSAVTAPVQYDGFGAGLCEMMYNVKETDMANTDKITCPVLICQAEKDIILTNKIKSQVNNAFPNAETYLVKNGGHQCIENRADELSKVTTEFLTEHL
ncbi:MAG: alpha/beta fold hydrolase, partial [Acutalibacteraceae bacterium]